MSTELPPSRKDSEAIQILATEHWSLLATRALTYQESLGRVNMFLAVLSGAVIALALIAQADRFGPTFVSVAVFMLAVVYFVGIATVRRLMMLNVDDYTWVVGMNRLRHTYLELHPELEPSFITGSHDDLVGALKTLGLDSATNSGRGSLSHIFVTLPGMLGVIVSSVAGAIGGLAAVGFGAPVYGILLAGALAFALSLGAILRVNRRSFRGFGPAVEPHFPTPPRPKE